MRLRISISTKDEFLLDEFKKDIEANTVKIKRFVNKRDDISDSKQSYIVLNSNALCDCLQRYGIHSRKTYDISLPNIPKEFFKDFFRGFFDGDGYMNLYRRKDYVNRFRYSFEIVSASKDMIYGLKNKLKEYDIDINVYIREPKTNGSFKQNVPTYRLISSSKTQIQNIIKFMYKDANERAKLKPIDPAPIITMSYFMVWSRKKI